LEKQMTAERNKTSLDFAGGRRKSSNRPVPKAKKQAAIYRLLKAKKKSAILQADGAAQADSVRRTAEAPSHPLKSPRRLVDPASKPRSILITYDISNPCVTWRGRKNSKVISWPMKLLPCVELLGAPQGSFCRNSEKTTGSARIPRTGVELKKERII